MRNSHGRIALALILTLIALMPAAASAESGGVEFANLADMQAYFGAGKRIGVQVGTIYDAIAKEYFPEAEVVYLNATGDMIAALTSGKIEGYLADKPVAYAECLANEELWMPDVIVEDDHYGIAMAKGNEALRDQASEVLAALRASGEMDAMADRWFLLDEAQKPMPELALAGENGELTLITSADSYPFSYVREGDVVGYEVELFLRICDSLGYSCKIQVADFAGALAAVSMGRADAALACVSITEERKETMLFTEPTYDGGMVMVVSADLRGDAAASGAGGFAGVFASVAESFERTFLRESRWKLIAQGLGTTVLISVLAALAGTLIGFGVCMARRSRLRSLSLAARVFVQIMQGTPIVVFLMILYYVVFDDINAVFVAVLGFALNFAAYVSEMMRTGIEAVDKGQLEAASAIGFSRSRAFLLITLPQAARHFLPVFKGEFISLVKMTSVVGYITIQDLTKMSDIIRSRTFDAFFPLVSTAVIYFLLSWLLARALSAIEVRVDPRRKKRVVKGVREEGAKAC